MSEVVGVHQHVSNYAFEKVGPACSYMPTFH